MKRIIPLLILSLASLLLGMVVVASCGKQEESQEGETKQPSSRQEEIKRQHITSVVIVQGATAKKLILNERRLKVFIEEFVDTLMQKPSYGHHPHEARIAADYEIILTLKDGTRREFEVYGRAVLRDKKTGGLRDNFNTGFKIEDWLDEIDWEK